MEGLAKVNHQVLINKHRKFRKSRLKKSSTMEVLAKINHQVLINKAKKIQKQPKRS